MIERIDQLHARLQFTIAGLLVLLLVWGLVCAWRSQVGQGYRAALWVAQLLIGAQCLLGAILLARAPAAAGGLALHIVYGVVALLGLPGALAYNRGRGGRWEALIFAAVCLFLLGVVIRAFETAQ
ncbi:MAG: hypothetical protein HXY37_11945 [Chloroflexi bacterium]|nr:hypothetical protein [Chloroflexota bacterium]